MGSQVVKALIEQRAKHKTNPDGITPEVSKPILQEAFKKVSQNPTLVEQKLVRSATNVGASSPSRPVQQILLLTNNLFSSPIEQKNAETAEDTDGTIEQKVFITSNTNSKIVEQRDARRAIINGGPIEQTAQASNDIDIQQFDFISLIFPPCGSIRNPVDTNILIRLTDFGFTFDLDTLVFKVDGIEVQNSPGFSTTTLVNGVQLDYNPPVNFDYSAEVNIFIQIQDTASTPNTFVFRCAWFTVSDTIDPVIQNFNLCDQTDVEPDAPVEFDLIDFQTGINSDSIKINVEGITVCSGITITDVPTTSGLGVHVRWDHPDAPFRYDSNVSVAIEAQDNAVEPNTLLFLCRFRVRQSVAPEFINFDPAPCDTFVDNTTGLKFEVYGVEDGIDISTLEVRVDSQNRKVFARPRIRRIS